jgi:xanthine dehydrogenase accessory factor
MTPTELFATAARLHDSGTEYALVSVVHAQSPTSARPGDKALVTGDGAIYGWIGGGCAQPAVIKTVRRALADGRARLIRIAPESGGEREIDDVLEFGMACHSGGALALFVDPVLPCPRLVIFGSSLVAVTLAQLAPRVGFAVSVASQGAKAVDFPDAQRVFDTDDPVALASQIAPHAYVVVATQGRRDLQALRAAVALGARYVAFVASSRKAMVLKESLRAGGVDLQALDAIVAPAGYPIAASTPEEIALSVLAAVVARRRGAHPAASQVTPATCCESAKVAPQLAPALAPASASPCCGT